MKKQKQKTNITFKLISGPSSDLTSRLVELLKKPWDSTPSWNLDAIMADRWPRMTEPISKDEIRKIARRIKRCLWIAALEEEDRTGTDAYQIFSDVKHFAYLLWNVFLLEMHPRIRRKVIDEIIKQSAGEVEVSLACQYCINKYVKGGRSK